VCRLLGYVAPSPKTLRQVLGGGYADFVQLAAERHGDGWGVAWPDGDGVAVRKEPRSAAEAAAFADTAETLATGAALVHLRWATLDLGVSLVNTHPFGDGQLAFAHNGSISEMPTLEALIGNSHARPAGDTDSERYWLTVQAAVERTGDPVRGLADAVLTLDRTCQFSSLNCLLLTPTELIAACWWRPEQRSPEVGPDYYDLAYHQEDTATVVASSGWHDAGWTPLPNGALLVLGRDGGQPRVEQVRSLAAA
jgi:predicted glutamine amidotransferase